ncbi:hypothetical protein [Sphingopyxis panaciterrae]
MLAVLVIAMLPFAWLVARDAMHLAFADGEETDRFVRTIAVPSLYQSITRHEELRFKPEPPPAPGFALPVIQAAMPAPSTALPSCFDLKSLEIEPRFRTDPPIEVAREAAVQRIGRSWGIGGSAEIENDYENIALSFSPFQLSILRACIDATPFAGRCIDRFRANTAERGLSLNRHRVNRWEAAAIVDDAGKPTGRYCALSAPPRGRRP